MNVYIMAEKGGTGKTTITTLLYLYIKNYYETNVNLIDSDLGQLSLYELFEDRKKNNLLSTNVAIDTKEIKDLMKDSESLNLIDGRANIDNKDSFYINNSDLIILVSSSSRFDLNNTKKIVDLFEENNVNFKVLLNMISDEKDYETSIKKLGVYNCFENYIKYRKNYKTIETNGMTDLDKSFTNFHKWQVKKEIENIVDEMFSCLEN